jgi:nicotinamidase-related amidase
MTYTQERFSANDAALVLIDHQSGIIQCVHDYSPAEFRNNVMALAKLGKVFNLPTVLSTSLGQGPNGPFIPEVVSLFPDVPVIDRPGIIDAWDDPKFVAAVEKTGRKNLIMAGVTVDVCLAFAAMHAVEAGYNVYGVIDASGGVEVTIRENAVARMKDHGVTPSIGPRLRPSCSGTGGCRPGKIWGGCSTTTITTTALQWTASSSRPRKCCRKRPSDFTPRSRRSSTPDLRREIGLSAEQDHQRGNKLFDASTTNSKHFSAPPR